MFIVTVSVNIHRWLCFWSSSSSSKVKNLVVPPLLLNAPTGRKCIAYNVKRSIEGRQATPTSPPHVQFLAPPLVVAYRLHDLRFVTRAIMKQWKVKYGHVKWIVSAMRSFCHIMTEKWFVLFWMCDFVALTRCGKLVSFFIFYSL